MTTLTIIVLLFSVNLSLRFMRAAKHFVVETFGTWRGRLLNWKDTNRYQPLFPWYQPLFSFRVFAIYEILLGWEQYEYCYETVQFPNPRPTQSKKN